MPLAALNAEQIFVDILYMYCTVLDYIKQSKHIFYVFNIVSTNASVTEVGSRDVRGPPKKIPDGSDDSARRTGKTRVVEESY